MCLKHSRLSVRSALPSATEIYRIVSQWNLACQAMPRFSHDGNYGPHGWEGHVTVLADES